MTELNCNQNEANQAAIEQVIIDALRCAEQTAQFRFDAMKEAYKAIGELKTKLAQHRASEQRLTQKTEQLQAMVDLLLESSSVYLNPDIDVRTK